MKNIPILALLCIIQLSIADDVYLSTGVILRNAKYQGKFVITGGDYYQFQCVDRIRKIPITTVLKIDSSITYNPQGKSIIEDMTDVQKKEYNISEQAHSQEPVKYRNTDSIADSLFLYKYYSVPSPNRILSVRSDTSGSTELQSIINSYNQLLITDAFIEYKYNVTEFLMSRTVIEMRSIKLFGNESADTTKGLIFNLYNFQDKYVWRDRTAYVDYNEIESLYRALIETENLYFKWNGKRSFSSRSARYRSIDNLNLRIFQNMNEPDVAVYLETGYTYPTSVKIDITELGRIKTALQRAVKRLN